MDDKIIKILYVEDDMDHAVLIRELLEEIKNVHYKLTHVQRLDEALTAYYDTEELCSIEKLINRAEESMNEQRKN